MVVIRIYVLTATGLFACDDDGLSDPYIKIRLGNKVIDDVKNY